MLVDEIEHEQLGAPPPQLVGQRQRPAGLGADDGDVVVVRRQLDRLVAQLAGGVDGAVEPADLALTLVERGAQRRRVGEVGDDDRDLRADRLELGERGGSAGSSGRRSRGGRAIRLAPAPSGTGRLATRTRLASWSLGEVAGEGEPDAAEPAGDQVVAAAGGTSRRDAGFGPSWSCSVVGTSRRRPRCATTRSVATEQVGHDGRGVGRRRRRRVEVDQRGAQVGVLARRRADDAEWPSRRPGGWPARSTSVAPRVTAASSVGAPSTSAEGAGGGRGRRSSQRSTAPSKPSVGPDEDDRPGGLQDGRMR